MILLNVVPDTSTRYQYQYQYQNSGPAGLSADAAVSPTGHFVDQ